MTAIAGIVQDGVVYIAGDSAGVSGTSLTVRADPKVFRRGGWVFGFTSSFRMGQLIRYKMKLPEVHGDNMRMLMCTEFVDALRTCLGDGGWASKENERESGGNFLAGVNGRLFEIYSDFQVAERIIPFTATGCGQDLMLGSLHATQDSGMHPEMRLQKALEAAAAFSAAVCPPFAYVSTDR